MGAGKLLGQGVAAIYCQKLTLGWGQDLGYILGLGSKPKGLSWSRDILERPHPYSQGCLKWSPRTVLKEYSIDLKQRDLW